jgi:hypothetical protein
MEYKIEETTYTVALGFGNVMQIQGMLTSAFSADTFQNMDITEDLTMEDLAQEDSQQALAASAKLMPLVLGKVLKKVNGEPVDSSFIDEDMPITHGMDLFNHVMEHISELNVPKVSEASSDE